MKVSLPDSPGSQIYYGLTISQWVTLAAVLVTLIVGVINLFSSLRTNKRTTFVNAVTSERVKWMGQLRELVSEYLQLTTYYERKPILKGTELDKFFERLVFLQHRIQLHLNHTGASDREINELIKRINKKIFEIYQADDFLKINPNDRFEHLMSTDKLQRNAYHKVLTDVALLYEVNSLEFIKESITATNKFIEEINKDFKKKNGYAGRDQLTEDVQALVDKTSEYLKEEWERVKREAKKGKLKKTKNKKSKKAK